MRSAPFSGCVFTLRGAVNLTGGSGGKSALADRASEGVEGIVLIVVTPIATSTATIRLIRSAWRESQMALDAS